MRRFVLVTRHPADCTKLQSLLDGCGFTVRPYPVLRLVDVADDPGWSHAVGSVREDASRAWLAVASPRAPERFVTGCRQRTAPELLQLPTAAVGTTTSAAAEAVGLDVQVVGPGTGAGLAEELLEHLQAHSTVIFACGHHRRPELHDALTSAGHRVIPVVVYRMEPTPQRELPPLGPSLEAVVLTSPRAAELYLQGVGGMALPCPHWALGPTTRDAAAALGIDCRIPEQPTMESLAEDLCTI